MSSSDLISDHSAIVDRRQLVTSVRAKVLSSSPLRAGARASVLKQMGQIICCSSAGEPRAPPTSTIPAPEHLSLSISSAPTENR
jgi:hypothetical protein